jgi:hypothetical protein
MRPEWHDIIGSASPVAAAVIRCGTAWTVVAQATDDEAPAEHGRPGRAGRAGAGCTRQPGDVHGKGAVRRARDARSEIALNEAIRPRTVPTSASLRGLWARARHAARGRPGPRSARGSTRANDTARTPARCAIETDVAAGEPLREQRVPAARFLVERGRRTCRGTSSPGHAAARGASAGRCCSCGESSWVPRAASSRHARAARGRGRRSVARMRSSAIVLRGRRITPRPHASCPAARTETGDEHHARGRRDLGCVPRPNGHTPAIGAEEQRLARARRTRDAPADRRPRRAPSRPSSEHAPLGSSMRRSSMPRDAYRSAYDGERARGEASFGFVAWSGEAREARRRSRASGRSPGRRRRTTRAHRYLPVRDADLDDGAERDGAGEVAPAPPPGRGPTLFACPIAPGDEGQGRCARIRSHQLWMMSLKPLERAAVARPPRRATGRRPPHCRGIA